MSEIEMIAQALQSLGAEARMVLIVYFICNVLKPVVCLTIIGLIVLKIHGRILNEK